MLILTKKNMVRGLTGGGVLMIALGLGLDIVRGRAFELGPFQIGLIIFGSLALLSAALIQWGGVRRWIGRLGIWLAGLLALVGLGLLLLNIIGQFRSLRHPLADTGAFHAKGWRVTAYEPEEVYTQVNRLSDESDQDYIYRLTQLIYDGMIHYWDIEDGLIGKVPLTENWLLWYQTTLFPSNEGYEYCNPYKAIERGVALCSQYSMVLVQLLEANGVQARLIGLTGHVIAEAYIAELGKWWVLDSDYGLVIENSATELAENLALVRAAYETAGYNETTVDLVVGIYEPTGNYIVPLGEIGICENEALRYQQKWWVPMLMLMPFVGVQGVIGERNKKRASEDTR